ncbi:hypothetical protein PENTCL1PPCAC_26743, partial [Pristionchus entomophagus]
VQVAIQAAGGRGELMEMYEARHRNWHRRGDDLLVPSPRSSMSRSPSPVPPVYSNPAELRERQSRQGMLDQRSKAVKGAFLHLLQKLYRARFERRYEEKKRLMSDAVKEREFAEEHKREEESFKREANEAKFKALDTNVKYRDFMQWLKEESERMEKEIECEVERRERRRWQRKMKDDRMDQSLLESSRLALASKLLDERRIKALKAREKALKHVEKREEVRRLENEARRAVAMAEIPSSARSSIDDASFLLNQSMRRYSIGNEPLRVVSARGGTAAETSWNASREGKSRDESRFGDADVSIGGRRRNEVIEMKEKLEEQRRQAEAVRRAMEDSEKRMTETELVSVAAQLEAHDDYIRGVESVGRVIAQNVQPRSPTGLPPGVEPLDLSSLDVEMMEEGEGEKSGEDSLEKSTDISGKIPKCSLSRDSLDGIPPWGGSLPSTESSKRKSSSSSSNKTLQPSSPIAEEQTEEMDENRKELIDEGRSTVSGEKRRDTVDVQFSPLSEGRKEELDRSLPSTAASTGRQEVSIDTVFVPEATVCEESVPNWARIRDPSIPDETPQDHSMDTVHDSLEEQSIPEEVERSTVPSRQLFSPIERTPTGSGESGSSTERGRSTVDGGRSTVDEKKESIEEISERSEEKEEEGEESLNVSAASLKKAISVASEMADPFDGFESNSGGSRKSEEKKEEKEKMRESAADAASATPATSLDVVTVVEKTMIEEEEISWGDGGGLEVGGGSARTEDFDWGVSLDEKRESEMKMDEGKIVEKPHSLEIPEEEKKEVKETKSNAILSLRERLNNINPDDEVEKKSEKTSSTSTSSSSTATSSSSSSQSSSSTTSSTEKSTSEGREEKSGQSTERKDEKGEEEEEEETTPRVPSVSGGLSSASGSIDFDTDVNPTVEVPSSSSTSRTPRAVSKSRFRLSLDDSFPDSPRETTTTYKSSSSSSTHLLNGRIMGDRSPRAATPTSPHTPRATMLSSLISPSGAASSEGRRNRFTAVMPLSPRSGRRSTSPKNISLSREVSMALDDSSFGDLSRLSAVELPTSSGGMSGFPPILSSLLPLVSPSSSFPPIRPSIGHSLNGSSIEEGDEMDESVYDLMDVKTPVSSVLSSLPIGELIGDDNEEEGEEEEIISPPLTLTARSNGSLHEQCQAITKNEFTGPRIDREVDQIWKIIDKKGFFTKEDIELLVEMDLWKEENDEITTLRNERIRLIRGVSCEMACTLYPRDERRMNDGRIIPKEIVPLRRLRPSISKERLKTEIEQKLLNAQSKQVPLHTTRMRSLGVEFSSLPIDERILYTELYANEENLFHSDLERGEILEVVMESK